MRAGHWGALALGGIAAGAAWLVPPPEFERLATAVGLSALMPGGAPSGPAARIGLALAAFCLGALLGLLLGGLLARRDLGRRGVPESQEQVGEVGEMSAVRADVAAAGEPSRPARPAPAAPVPDGADLLGRIERLEAAVVAALQGAREGQDGLPTGPAGPAIEAEPAGTRAAASSEAPAREADWPDPIRVRVEALAEVVARLDRQLRSAEEAIGRLEGSAARPPTSALGPSLAPLASTPASLTGIPSPEPHPFGELQLAAKTRLPAAPPELADALAELRRGMPNPFPGP